MLQTPLNEKHRELKAKLADFAGWELPLYYSSQIDEHNAVRTNAGMFDVSHMNVVDIEGHEVVQFLHYLLANNIDKIKISGGALYSCMLNYKGGVVDDLIVYKKSPEKYCLVLNAATYIKDMAWLNDQVREFKLNVAIKERIDLAMIAVQGPLARRKVHEICTNKQCAICENLKYFQGIEASGWWIARTGYTGEDGYEIMLPAFEAPMIWQQLLDIGVKPCGLVARDSLRLEAGYCLYGSEMDETISPFEANLAWTVAFDPVERNFIGRLALDELERTGIKYTLVGLILEEQGGIMRAHQKVIIPNVGEGIITSGGYSPTLSCSIALARVPMGFTNECFVVIRNKELRAKIVKPAFVKNGKSIVKEW